MSSSDLAIVIADAIRLRDIRNASPFTSRVLYFSDSNLVSAFESIRAHEPGVVALETHFAHTPEGRAFVDRLRWLATWVSEVQLLSFAKGEWSISVLGAATPGVVAAPATQTTNTRRVPRFPLVDPLAMKVDGQPTSLIDMSVMGAQVLSMPQLRPSQRLKITLPDEGGSLHTVSAWVAWSAFEIPAHALRPYYRAGVEFTDAAAQMLDDYCKRHCSDEPLALRL